MNLQREQELREQLETIVYISIIQGRKTINSAVKESTKIVDVELPRIQKLLAAATTDGRREGAAKAIKAVEELFNEWYGLKYLTNESAADDFRLALQSFLAEYQKELEK